MQELLILSNPVSNSPCCIPVAAGSEPPQYHAYGISDFPAEPMSVISSALTGGTYLSYLQQEMEKSQGRLCLHLAALRMCFRLPSYDGAGQELEEVQLDALLQCHTAHFSEYLFCNYIYMAREHSVILFDDTASLQRKWHAAEACGIPYAILTPEVQKKLRLPEKQGV